MSAIPQILQGTFSDLRTLAQQYGELSRLKVRASGRALTVAVASFTTAALLGIIALAELIFALAIQLAGSETLAVRVPVIAAILTLAVAGICAVVGMIYMKKIDVKPTIPAEAGLSHDGRREDPTWQTTT